MSKENKTKKKQQHIRNVQKRTQTFYATKHAPQNPHTYIHTCTHATNTHDSYIHTYVPPAALPATQNTVKIHLVSLQLCLNTQQKTTTTTTVFFMNFYFYFIFYF